MCLFALDKPQAIPVDTHVWQLATRWYLPSLKGTADALRLACTRVKVSFALAVSTAVAIAEVAV